MTLNKARIKKAAEEKAPPHRPPHVYPLPIRRLHEAFRRHEAAALQKFDLGLTYIKDGAYNSGAICLRAAADEFEKAQAARNDALNLMTKKGTVG